MLADDRWLGVVLEARKLSRLSLYTKDPLTAQREGTSLLLAGTNEGHVALVDTTTGDVQFHLKVRTNCNGMGRDFFSLGQIIHKSDLGGILGEKLSLIVSCYNSKIQHSPLSLPLFLSLQVHSGPVTLMACDAKQNYIFSASNGESYHVSHSLSGW